MAIRTAGRGRISLELHGEETVFSELSSTYPLKLLSPRTHRVGLVYLITYGGGLVNGDQVSLSVDVGSRANLVMLSQGSTKVFKFRPGQRAASIDAVEVTTQRMDVTVASGGGLFLLPDPVTCFENASYNQIQTFHLASDASLAVLDWVTSGRKSRGEEWVFSRYYSVNEIVVDGRRVAKDVMLLENEATTTKLPVRTLASKLDPYGCYATLLLYGPQLAGVMSALAEEYSQIQVFKSNERAGLLWSLSELGNGGCIVRIAGKETEDVKKWLARALRPLEMVVGREIWRVAV
ncbi:UreD urease accessory protein-domain-containing protein [Mycena sanguinolenta]|nr:UreD urease accessory protein-domain-containing protein [Mycena sanguinolenta]